MSRQPLRGEFRPACGNTGRHPLPFGEARRMQIGGPGDRSLTTRRRLGGLDPVLLRKEAVPVRETASSHTACACFASCAAASMRSNISRAASGVSGSVSPPFSQGALPISSATSKHNSAATSVAAYFWSRRAEGLIIPKFHTEGVTHVKVKDHTISRSPLCGGCLGGVVHRDQGGVEGRFSGHDRLVEVCDGRGDFGSDGCEARSVRIAALEGVGLFCPAWISRHHLPSMAAIQWIANLGSRHHRMDRGDDSCVHGIARLAGIEGGLEPRQDRRHYDGVHRRAACGLERGPCVRFGGKVWRAGRRFDPDQFDQLGGIFRIVEARAEITPRQFDDVLRDDAGLAVHLHTLLHGDRSRRDGESHIEWLDRDRISGSLLFRAGIHRMV